MQGFVNSQSQVCLVASAPAWKWGRVGFISKSFARDLSRDMGCVTPLYCSVAIVWQVPAELSWAIKWETLHISPCHIELGHV